MKFILAFMSMLVLISGQKGKGGSFNGFPGNSGLNGHGQNHDGEFPGLDDFPGNGLGNGGEFPGGGNGHGHGNGHGGGLGGGGNGHGGGLGGGNDGHGNGLGGGFPGGGNGNGGGFPGGGNGNGGNGHGNGHGGGGHGGGDDDHGGLPVPVPGPIVNPGGLTGPSLANKLGAFFLLKNLLDQGDDYDYDYDFGNRLPRAPRIGQCVTGPVLRTFAGRKLLCDFNGACPAGSSCQNGLCCNLPAGTLVRRRRP